MRHRNETVQLEVRILAAVLAATCASWVAATARRAAAEEPAAGVETEAKGGEPLRLVLLWTPQSQFAGTYVAEDRGLYRKRGLDVRILRGGPDRDPVAALEKGEADFAVLWLVSALVAEDRGFRLAHICQVFQRSHLGIAAWKDRGVRTVADLQGRRISLWGEPYRPAFTAFLKKNGVTPEVIPQYGTVSLFLLRAVDACSVMDYNEYQGIYLSGIDEEELVLLRPGEDGVSFPEDGIYCARKTLRERPEACKALAEATIEGWTYAAEHPDEALDSVMRRVEESKLPSNRALMRRMLRKVLPSAVPGSGESWRPGELRRESYDAAVRWMRDLEVIDGAPAFEELVGRDPGR